MALALSPFPDIAVWVKNENQADWTLAYDGKEYYYPALKAVRVPAEVAWFHFAFDTRGDMPPHRDTTGNKDERGQTWYDNRLAAYTGAGLSHMQHLVAEFKNFRFKVAPVARTLESVDFDKIK